MANIVNHLGTIGAFMIVFGGFILWPIAYFITGRYFDNQLGLKKINNIAADIFPFSSLFRAGQYCTLIVFHRGMKKSYDRYVYDDRDFRKLARSIDKWVAFPFTICCFGGLVILSIGAVIHLTFYLLSLF